MTSRFMLIFAAISGFIFVALGAFGAHVLSKTMGAVEMGWIQTGLEYQAFHTLAILGLAVAMQRRISIWFYWSSVFLAFRHGVVQRQPLLPGAVPSAFVGVCHSGWRRELPRGLGVNVSWCYPFKAQGRKS